MTVQPTEQWVHTVLTDLASPFAAFGAGGWPPVASVAAPATPPNPSSFRKSRRLALVFCGSCCMSDPQASAIHREGGGLDGEECPAQLRDRGVEDRRLGPRQIGEKA